MHIANRRRHDRKCNWLVLRPRTAVGGVESDPVLSERPFEGNFSATNFYQLPPPPPLILRKMAETKKVKTPQDFASAFTSVSVHGARCSPLL